MTEILPVSSLLIETALSEGWLEDEERNRRRGFGSGPGGIEKATESFLAASKNGMWGLYQDSKAIGWLLVEQESPGVVRLDLFADPRYMDAASEAVEKTLSALLRHDIRRIYVSIPEIDGDAVEFWSDRCGFAREGKSWAALVVDGKERDLVNFVMTRSRWRKRSQQESKE